MNRVAATATWAGLLLAAVADWVAQRSGWVAPHPQFLAAIVVAVLLFLLVDVASRSKRLATSRPRALTAMAGLAWRTGLGAVLATGMVQWLTHLQGYLILSEAEDVPLQGGAQFSGFEQGPLAPVDELSALLRLERLHLVPRGPDTFAARSELRVLGPPPRAAHISVEVGRPGVMGTLRLHQGAFGFAPRVVVLKEGTSLFDQYVPFRTVARGRGLLSFDGAFTVEPERLEVLGNVTLEGLDEAMRGHPTLELSLKKESRVLGSGRLKPGQFAEIGGGYRVGFAGLKRWAEIGVSRARYPTAMLAGAALLALGILGHLGLLLARWRR